jgi:hypothetical protein
MQAFPGQVHRTILAGFVLRATAPIPTVEIDRSERRQGILGTFRFSAASPSWTDFRFVAISRQTNSEHAHGSALLRKDALSAGAALPVEVRDAKLLAAHTDLRDKPVEPGRNLRVGGGAQQCIVLRTPRTAGFGTFSNENTEFEAARLDAGRMPAQPFRDFPVRCRAQQGIFFWRPSAAGRLIRGGMPSRARWSWTAVALRPRRAAKSPSRIVPRSSSASRVHLLSFQARKGGMSRTWRRGAEQVNLLCGPRPDLQIRFRNPEFGAPNLKGGDGSIKTQGQLLVRHRAEQGVLGGYPIPDPGPCPANRGARVSIAVDC